MVAVTDRKFEVCAVFCKALPHAGKCCIRRRTIEQIALEVTAVLHQIEVIELRQALPLGLQCADDGIFRVVDQQHDMRRLQHGVAPHRHARRQALKYGPLGGTDGRGRTGSVVIAFEVYCADDAAAHSAVRLRAPYINQCVPVSVQQRVAIVLHRLGNFRKFCRIVAAQIRLGQYHMQRARRIADKTLDLVPVFRLTGKLVAGDDRPLSARLRIPDKIRQKDVRLAETHLLFHIRTSQNRLYISYIYCSRNGGRMQELPKKLVFASGVCYNNR